jgi:hypothetical protein
MHADDLNGPVAQQSSQGRDRLTVEKALGSTKYMDLNPLLTRPLSQLAVVKKYKSWLGTAMSHEALYQREHLTLGSTKDLAGGKHR